MKFGRAHLQDLEHPYKSRECEMKGQCMISLAGFFKTIHACMLTWHIYGAT